MSIKIGHQFTLVGNSHTVCTDATFTLFPTFYFLLYPQSYLFLQLKSNEKKNGFWFISIIFYKKLDKSQPKFEYEAELLQWKPSHILTFFLLQVPQQKKYLNKKNI